ncbi:MAG: tetratricopeptide repeat protein [Parabacteroides sp.]|nr:tetratricopeptide repeat protein [Parabacteroides sp.]
MLLEDYFPSLRRIDYTLAYIARPFDVNEAKLVIQTKPQYLSLNEMFLVANTYPKDSPEFKEVFDIAVRLYSTDPVAQQNTAALEIERDAIDAGIKRLEAINTPEAWNNLGVAYAQKKEYQKALDYFSKAANAGVKAAIQNQEELSNWLKEQ